MQHSIAVAELFSRSCICAVSGSQGSDLVSVLERGAADVQRPNNAILCVHCVAYFRSGRVRGKPCHNVSLHCRVETPIED